MKNIQKILRYILTATLVMLAFALCFACGAKSPQDEPTVPSDSTPPVYYTVIYEATGGGKIIGESRQTVESGKSSVSVTATPDTGYKFVRWSDGGDTPQRQETNVTASVYAFAIFEKRTVRITYTADEGGVIEGEKSQDILYNNLTKSVTAKPLANYKFTGWSDNKMFPTRQDVATEDTEIIAHFVYAPTHTLQYNADKGGHILGETLQYVPENETAGIVRAVPDTGYVFAGWSDGFPDAERIDLSVTDKTVTAKFRYAFDGQGTEQCPYQINSYQALQDMRQHPNAHYLLTQDLDMQGISHIPVFDDLIRFRGVFDGNGHTVKNLTIDTDEDFPSLFGFSDGDIFNLRVTDFSITVPDLYLDHPISVGAVCAVANGNLSDIHVSGSIQSNKLCPSYRAIIGGLVGTTFGTVQNCTADIQIHIDDDLPTNTVGAMGLINVGGLIGWTYGDVLSCRSSGEISWTSDITTSGGVRFVAGLVGVSSHSDITDTMTVSDCTSSVSIQTDCNVSCGGLLGYFNMPNTAILIENCNASGNIQIDNAESGTAGGFAYGLTLGVNSIVQNCYATGNVSAGSANGFSNNVSSRNGFITIQNCYATGDILATSHANGFSDGLTDVLAVDCYSVSQVIGRYASGFVHTVQGTIRYCYATGNVTASNIACGFINVVHGNIEQCYSAGTVYAPQAATGFIFGLQDGSVKNCYSSSDIIMTNEDINTVILASGFVEANKGLIANCYYSGKISGYTTKNTNVGAIISHNRGSVRNCHWLYYEDSLAQQAISRNYGTDEAIYRYEAKADMFTIADLLNGNTQDVWINVDSDTPKFKFPQ